LIDDIPGTIRQSRPDIVFSVLTDYIFKQKDIDSCRLGIVNLHPAPLPDYRGCNSYSHAIINGDKEYGVSLHYVNNKIDQGNLIEVDRFPIEGHMAAKELYDISQVHAFNLFKKWMPKLIEGRVEAKNQEGKTRYYPRTSLLPLKTAPVAFSDELYDLVRGLDFPPHEPAFIQGNDKRKIYLRRGQ